MVGMTTRTSAIEVAGLRKSYGDHEVVAGVDLTVPAGTPYEDAHPAIVAWTQSPAVDRGTNELTLNDLQAMLES
ncbi:hypothetical protein M2157_009773 [Streptomyces sp. SAI-127]|jgi:hypothetical protein|nr:hypothetical protein [Streptomyces sp. SAI-127]